MGKFWSIYLVIIILHLFHFITFFLHSMWGSGALQMAERVARGKKTKPAWELSEIAMAPADDSCTLFWTREN